ncbi:MAG: hypothetical protein R6U98_08870 [Pirellulaceae bacterium]
MVETLLTREVVIGLAVLGAVLSLLASFMQAKSGEGRLVKVLVWAGYGFMGLSMVIFVTIGLLGMGQA